MKIKNYSQEELEKMAYDDLAYVVLSTKGKKMKLIDIFNEISTILNLNSKQYEDRISDFYTLLSTEKRFIQLEEGFWDLKENHSSKVTINDTMEESEEDDEIEDFKLSMNEDDDEEIDYYDTKNDDDTPSDGLEDLVIIEDETEEE